MTVQSTITDKTFYPGNALASQSLAGLVFFDPEDVRVQTLDANGVPAVLLARDVDYVLSGDGATGTASITPLASWPNTVRWFVSRQTEAVQPEAFPVQQPLSSRAVERGLNRQALVAQEHRAAIERAPLALPGQAAPPIDAAAIAPGQVLAMIDGRLAGVNNDPASAADSAAQADAAKLAVLAAKSETEGLRDAAASSANLAATYGNMPARASWAVLSGLTGAANDLAIVMTDTGTHTDPVVGGTVSNSGIFRYSTSPAGWERIGNTAEADAKAQVALAAAQAASAAFATLANRFQIDNRNTYLTVTPGSAWNGTAGSGFGAVPADPARTTAKPACVPLEPPNQYFTSYQVVGVSAWANNAGSLDNCGLEKVIVHYEGRTAEILEPSFYSYRDVNGQTRTLFGWWAVLLHNGTNGHARVYFEAVPKDATMQRRVIGPYQYSPQAAIYDVQLTVAPSQPEIAGQRYQSLDNAMAYCRTSARQNPLITFVEPGTYDLSATGSVYSGQGRCNITASVPVTFAKAAYVSDATSFRTRYDGMHIFGANITIDMQFAAEIFKEGGSGVINHWLDGVTVIHDPSILWRKSGRPVSFLVRGNPWFTECRLIGGNDMGKNANLARNNYMANGFADCISAARCVIGNTIANWSSASRTVEIPSLTVQYTGAGGTATLSRSSSGSTRTFTARVDGVSVGTFTVDSTEAAFLAGTNYNVANVVNWLNSLAGWTATLLDDSRVATVLGLTGTKTSNNTANFTNVDCKTAPLTLVTMFDVHADWGQYNVGSTAYENIVIANNTVIGAVTQNLFIGNNSSPIRDFIVVNNSFHNDGDSKTNAIFSQFLGNHGHMVTAHNTFANQELRCRSSNVVDAYCLLANNALVAFAAEVLGGVTGAVGLTIRDNHLQTGGNVPPANFIFPTATGTTVGGAEADLFPRAASGDFTPAGVLLSNLKRPVIRHGARGTRRSLSDVAGALAA